ncbi:hypothetical protein MA16_Dca009560 [Dendrobium catenatum]|uniref:Retrovirus-related Pol polyprotein from transposon TNT 1-94 n=1 Tax=Dendrobium catenatum TaxID=906689 RepID=A0A2I0VS05_9ASPA|nr:hypothetical protein MA16_Dca009560 [Dendrobium catenatum]
MNKLFNMKMVDSTSMAEHLNNLNTITSHLCHIGIKFNDKIRNLLLLSSLPKRWPNYCGE